MGEDYCEVVLHPDVKTALAAIKRLPGRRVAGRDAQRLVMNPYAFFGPDAAAVFDEASVEAAVASIRVELHRLDVAVEREEDGAIAAVDIVATSSGRQELRASKVERVGSAAMLEAVVRVLQKGIADGSEYVTWRRIDFEIDGDSPAALDRLVTVHREWDSPSAIREHEGEALVRALEIFDLDRYGARVDGIGIETPYSIAKIPKPADGKGWLPDEIALAFHPKVAAGPEALLTVSQVST